MTQSQGKHIAVIGAGIVGVSTAAALLQEGHRVTVIDPASPGGPHAASYGNGAFISPASILPMSQPGLWRKVPRMLADPRGALTIRWRDLPALMPWLVRFLWVGATQDKVSRTARALTGLLADAPQRHVDLAARAGLSCMIVRNGLLYAFRERAEYEADGFGWRLRRDNGVAMAEIAGEALRRAAPALDPAYRFGILIKDGAHCADPGGYVDGLATWLIAQGVVLRRDRVIGFDLSEGRLRGLRCADGDVACEMAVIAAGMASAPLAASLGDPVPLAAERGYHVELSNASITLDIPIMPQDGKMANVSTRGGLRAAGQVEIAAPDAPPNWTRAEILFEHLKQSYPALAGATFSQAARWQGNRPSTPDGKPVIGRSTRSGDVVYAFGHGHIGLASAPMTAALVADLVAGRQPVRDLTSFAPTRFSLRQRETR
ncbi:MAG: FAD-binding oxidoreductase [Alphaproteobacteria bacterium]|nr:FAD-binding oxidoreductase [Alphaproteobacteria bacterium]MBU1573523.1 FAD-binding oxidoreductase [Alphaproteobacteria bacterium]MBU2079519.1 FAD-binding oxidoreductase [Alphaproteobacteria bacterium]MBU2161970.1 FAD-binding oxidoreductase [Alphaproteobacteria bacterium]MBU2242597.1 FAD-binding oxidoreductase [Alphaproteobacteria bacterium]